MSTNPIKYTDRDFITILASINADPLLVDRPEWIKRLIAGIGDVVSVWNNAAANESFLRTAFTRQSVTDLLAYIDYQIVEKTTSNGNLFFDISASATFPLSVDAANLRAQTTGKVQASAKRFEARSGATFTASVDDTAYSSWNTGTGVITVSHVFTTGEKVRLTTTGALPAGTNGTTDYFAIYVSATQIKLAISRKNALAGTAIAFTSQGTGTHTINRLSRSVLCYQQESKESYSIGESDGVTEWQEFNIDQENVIKDTIQIVINGVGWSRVTSFLDSSSIDRHYKVIYNTDDTCRIQFGNGTYGAIPGTFAIFTSFAFGGGTISNVSAPNTITNYIGSDENITGVFNTGAMIGGAENQSLELAKVLGPMLLKARDRFVTADDGEALTLAYGGLSKARVNPNVYGVLSAQVVAIANGGGNPSGATRTAVQTYLIDRTSLGGIDVRFDEAVITPINVTSAARMQPGYTWANVLPYFRLAWKLFTTETGAEIYATYIESGIDAAITQINSILTESFVASDSASVMRILDMLETITPRDFGESIQESDAFTFIQGSVMGIDYMTIAAPSFPIAFDPDEISTVGTLTLTEIV